MPRAFICTISSSARSPVINIVAVFSTAFLVELMGTATDLFFHSMRVQVFRVAYTDSLNLIIRISTSFCEVFRTSVQAGTERSDNSRPIPIVT
jgi:hypothetical protein